MHKHRSILLACSLLSAAACLQPGEVAAQQPIGHTSATEVQVSGAVDLRNGDMLLGNGSTITAASKTVKIVLNRGGQLRLCSTTSLHLAKDRTVADPENAALMMALDRGALEADYTVGKYSDVLLTPDLRILISGPGEANLSVRINAQGDTCVDNHGKDAPYVTVSSQLEGGVYRVLPNQRVTFEHGSLMSVVDHEPEPCGCPAAPVESIATAGAPSKNAAKPGQPVGGPSSIPADTAFPLAESEGLAPPPPLTSKPVVPVGEAHAQVTVPLTYSGDNPPAPSAAPAAPAPAAPAPTAPAPTAPAPQQQAVAIAAPSPASASPAATPSIQNNGGFFHRVGRFFSHLFH